MATDEAGARARWSAGKLAWWLAWWRGGWRGGVSAWSRGREVAWWRGGAVAGHTLRQALGTPHFRWLYAMAVLGGPGMFIPFAHASAAARDLGVPDAQAVGLVGLIGVGTGLVATLGALQVAVQTYAQILGEGMGGAAAVLPAGRLLLCCPRITSCRKLHVGIDMPSLGGFAPNG